MGSKPKGISASRGAAVLGFSEFQSPLEVWQRIMEEREHGFNTARGYVMPGDPDSAAIRWGLAFEDAVVRLAEMETGLKIEDREQAWSRNVKGECLHADSNDKFITCHIDGRYDNNSGNKWSCPLHEGKTTSAFSFREKWGEPGTEKIPRSYQVQAQHQLLCTGADECIVSVLVFPEMPDVWEKQGWKVEEATKNSEFTGFILKNDTTTIKPIIWAEALRDMGFFHQYPVKAKPVVQQKLVKAYREFWEKHVLAEKPPEPRNYDDIKRLCPEPKTTIVVPEFIKSKMAEYKSLTEETAWAKTRKERLKTIITKYAAEHEGKLDDESAEAVIFRDTSGGKLGSWSKNKNGGLVFRC